MFFNWRKYDKIENTYNNKIINQIREMGFDDGLWIVTEKVDGQNISFITDGNIVHIAKRNGFLSEDEIFGGVPFYKDKYIPIVKEIFKVCTEMFGHIDTVTVYGEDYGGVYNHPNVSKVGNSRRILGRVFYRPDNDFIAFDLAINRDNEMFYVDIHTAYDIFNRTGMPFIPILFEGTFDECLNYPNKFQTTIPGMFGLPEIKNNFCEGVVIKPNIYKVFNNGNRVILKNKNEKFFEKKTSNEINNNVNVNPQISERVINIQNHLDIFITENRLRNVLSHIGPVTKNDFNRIVIEMIDDVMMDYNKEFENEFNILTSNESRIINKWLNKSVSQLIRNNLQNIVDGTF